MRAATVCAIPAPEACRGGCRYEPKWDGFRAIGNIDEDRHVRLYSRRGTPLNDPFPEITDALRTQLPAGTVVDGEIVRWSDAGRLDFDALQRRMAAGSRTAGLAHGLPCHVVLFDVLETDGADLRRQPLRVRRATLERLLAGSLPTDRAVLCPQTSDAGEARLWFQALPAQGIEGLVIKAADDPYLMGQRRWAKVKHRTTTEMIVGGVGGPLTDPHGVILGRYTRAGVLRVVARAPVPAADHARLAQLATPAGDLHPWPPVLPAGWAGSMSGSEPPTRYTRVVPNLVVEVQVDVAASTAGGCACDQSVTLTTYRPVSRSSDTGLSLAPASGRRGAPPRRAPTSRPRPGPLPPLPGAPP